MSNPRYYRQIEWNNVHILANPRRCFLLESTAYLFNAHLRWPSSLPVVQENPVRLRAAFDDL